MEIKTMAGWHEFAENNSNGSWDKYCKPGDLVDEGVYDYFLDVLPPRSMERGYLQVGEPHSHQMNVATGKVQATYATFRRAEKGIWMYCGNCFAGMTWDADSASSSLEGFLKVTYRKEGSQRICRPRLVCKDGFSMSIQAGEDFQCTPREHRKDGDYTAVELGCLSSLEELLVPYAEDKDALLDTTYPYVPVELVKVVIETHGGIYG
ncbi:hypothetical protein NSB25_11135 [Acetatifactor muris]|uniref:Uncharacterized protein n=1 Tax=Acetatifactor muris TaxID=879566 RepID=A0A2K4ZGQ0_9FIRM|nr:hypothetical protein [Acetatifactor muris]MCR2047837.1 hypothetical protein [Acetatifactor muris]SOY29641.1 hypothetical protein AMURIS_02362 [Acetatifactor muris]